MSDEKLKSVLSAYEVPDADTLQIETAIQKAHQIKPVRIPTKAYSLWRQIKVQATYLSKWFYISCGFLFVLCIILSAAMDTLVSDLSNLYSCLAPLLVIPCAVAIYRTFADRMFELEASCKYSFSKIIAGKMLLLGSFVTAGLICSWFIGSLFTRSIDIRAILFALISFSTTCVAILWFGRRNMIKGLCAGGIWAVIFTSLKLWEVSVIYINYINNGLLCLILVLCIGLVILSAITNLKNLNLQEDYKWNFALTE